MSFFVCTNVAEQEGAGMGHSIGVTDIRFAGWCFVWRWRER